MGSRNGLATCVARSALLGDQDDRANAKLNGFSVHASRWGETPATRVQTETGTMLVSTPESTAFDLVRFPAACGG